MRFVLVNILLACSLFVSAQQMSYGRLTVTILNEKNEPLENVTVELLKGNDSSLVKIALSDNKGLAEFEKINFGSYFLKTTAVNYTTAYSTLFSISAEATEFKLPNMLLKAKTTQMGEVVV